MAEQQSAQFEVGDERLIGLLEEQPAHQGDVRFEGSIGLHGIHHRQAVALGGGEVVRAERRGDMDEAAAVIRRDVVPSDHVVGVRHIDQVERGDVRQAFQFVAGEFSKDLIRSVGEHGGRQIRGQQQGLVVGADHLVGRPWLGRDGHVGHQRPRRRGPHQQGQAREPVGQFAVGHREPHIHRRVDDVLVALGDLMIGQAGSAPWAVRADPVILAQQALVEDLLQ